MEDSISSRKKLKISFGYAWTTSNANDEIRDAFKASKFVSKNDHHSIALNLNLSYKMTIR